MLFLVYHFLFKKNIFFFILNNYYLLKNTKLNSYFFKKINSVFLFQIPNLIPIIFSNKIYIYYSFFFFYFKLHLIYFYFFFKNFLFFKNYLFFLKKEKKILLIVDKYLKKIIFNFLIFYKMRFININWLVYGTPLNIIKILNLYIYMYRFNILHKNFKKLTSF